jgi:hypothetical protein
VHVTIIRAPMEQFSMLGQKSRLGASAFTVGESANLEAPLAGWNSCSGSFKELKHGKGYHFLGAEPVELAHGELTSAADLDSYVAARADTDPTLSSGNHFHPASWSTPLRLRTRCYT